MQWFCHSRNLFAFFLVRVSILDFKWKSLWEIFGSYFQLYIFLWSAHYKARCLISTSTSTNKDTFYSNFYSISVAYSQVFQVFYILVMSFLFFPIFSSNTVKFLLLVAYYHCLLQFGVPWVIGHSKNKAHIFFTFVFAVYFLSLIPSVFLASFRWNEAFHRYVLSLFSTPLSNFTTQVISPRFTIILSFSSIF